ncbi:tetratricopeptide repeat protein [Mucilaginibacter angelicae]|uniref:Tetratricopeptide repeat protein n=1 Tax=Mucilaginibacter angelicae TaxID=869718 RepID=A0ABV6LCH3_9SPHI
MKTYHKILLLFMAVALSLTVKAQSNQDAVALVKEGVALHDQGKYSEAIEKYQAALKLDPNYPTAYHEMSFTLFSSGKAKEAIPYLEKLMKLDPKSGGAYDMLGSIYDDDNQPEKAIELFQKGLSVDPDYQRLHYNLSITYYRVKKYKESEDCAVDAIKLDPKHASSQRAYAMALEMQSKRGCALLAWCSFLMLEPQTKRSIGAYQNIQNILHHGIKKTGEKSVDMTINTSDLNSGNLLLPMTIVNATSGKSSLTVTDSLKLQLTKVFAISDLFYGDPKSEFYTRYMAGYFKQMAESENMEAFAHLISLAANQDENVKWFKENEKQLIALDTWVAHTKREF